MQDLARRLSPFEEVRIVYTVRHQVDYIQSIWLQLAKNGKAPRFSKFLSHALERQLASGLWIEHGDVINHVLTGFSADQLIILDYKTSQCHPEGMIGPFLDLLNSPVRLRDMQDLDSQDANISPDALATWIAHSTYWPLPGNPNLVRCLQSVLAKSLQQYGKKRTTLYTREEYKKVGEAFTQPNAKLARWLEVNSSNGSLSEPASPETLLFREDLTLSDWSALAHQVIIDRTRR